MHTLIYTHIYHGKSLELNNVKFNFGVFLNIIKLDWPPSWAHTHTHGVCNEGVSFLSSLGFSVCVCEVQVHHFDAVCEASSIDTSRQYG